MVEEHMSLAAAGPLYGRRGLTLAAIGRRAGVSASTVSKVLNHRPDVASDTRRRIRAVLDAYGYPSPDGHRGSLIDVVMIDLDDPWAGQVLAEVERAARSAGLGIVPAVSHTQSIPDELLTQVLARNNRHMITIFADLTAAQQNRLQAHDVSYVVVAGGRSASASVGVDFRTSVRTATDHLIAIGHRRIGLLLGPRDLIFTEQRFRGYQDALRRARLQVDPGLVRWGRFDQQSAADHARDLLAWPDPPTAIIAGSDTMAIGVYGAAAERGLEAGRDLAVVGFDDRPEAGWMTPPLTTVRMPLGRLADAAVDRLIEPRTATDRPSVFPGDLIIRESTSWQPGRE